MTDLERARTEYISNGRSQSLKSLAVQFNIPYRKLLEVARSENWKMLKRNNGNLIKEGSRQNPPLSEITPQPTSEPPETSSGGGNVGADYPTGPGIPGTHPEENRAKEKRVESEESRVKPSIQAEVNPAAIRRKALSYGGSIFESVAQRFQGQLESPDQHFSFADILKMFTIWLQLTDGSESEAITTLWDAFLREKVKSITGPE